MNYYLKEMASIVSGTLVLQGKDTQLQNIIIDSRKISLPSKSIFIAFITDNNDGHRYIKDAYDRGVRCFMVSKKLVFKIHQFTFRQN